MHHVNINHQTNAKSTFWRMTIFLFLTLFTHGTSLADNQSTGTILVHGNIKCNEEASSTHASANVSTTKDKIQIEVSLEMLSALEETTFTSSAPWTDQPTEYTGVRVNTFLESIGALSTTFKAAAGNNYQFVLSDIDFDKYPIIIAYKKNGEALNARTLGPFLIMFPFDDFPELLNEKNKAASVWQLTEIEVL